MEKSAQINELAAALAKAQSEMPPVPMNGFNPFFGSQYADLGSVIETSGPILAQNGLSISQLPSWGQGTVGVSTMLMHDSGQWVQNEVLLPLSEFVLDDDGKQKRLNVAQEAGKIITYLRRYAWSAVLGLYADEDTDGEGAPRQGGGGRRPSGGGRLTADAPLDQILSTKIWFGKHKEPGHTFGDIEAQDPGYFDWLSENSDHQDTVAIVNKIIAARGDTQERAPAPAPSGQNPPHDFPALYDAAGAAGVSSGQAKDMWVKKFGMDGWMKQTDEALMACFQQEEQESIPS